jgi:putative transposase
MTDLRYRRTAGSVFSLKYHLVWCPKYRRRILVGEIAEELRNLLYEKAKAMDITIEALEIMPDHVHLFVGADPTEAPQHLANQFKGYTSRMLGIKFPSISRRLPSLWSRSYYVGSIGYASEGAVKNYIARQRKK